MKKLLTALLAVLMVLTIGVASVSAEGEEPVEAVTTCWPEDVDIDKIGYRIVKASAPNKEYNGKRNPADIEFALLKSGIKVTGLKKIAIDDLIEDLKDSKTPLDVILAFKKEKWEDWNCDYMVVYTQKNKFGHDVIVEPKDAGTYTATIILRPLTARFDCSFLRKDCGLWHLSRYTSVDFTIDPAEYRTENDAAFVEFTAPKAIDGLVANGKEQVLAEAGKVVAKDGDKEVELPIEYSLDGEHWTKDINSLTGKKADTYKVLYRVNAKGADGYNSNFQTYDSEDMFIRVTIEPTPVRPYTPVVTGC